MKVKALVGFRSKLLKPCRKLILIFKFRLNKSAFIRRASRFHSRKSKYSQKLLPRKPSMSSLLSVFRSSKESIDKGRLEDNSSRLSNVHETLIFPSPAYVRARRGEKGKGEASAQGQDVEDACRSFENYLVEMIVQEGKTTDLMDVEELLYCWKNLKCPVFIDLVCRFYGELCKDLFSSDSEQDHSSN
ncbi:hypothetical protein L6164_030728 [Bauhinia variegata]|uniref:Uncharacterized protein n=1 Tax=Bauhinia variegata TaxID=167791 RepID=A0ACB9LD90_BAUVA|nr:hypothetical protein L6164_030728 [Bauhinia variegata]